MRVLKAVLKILNTLVSLVLVLGLCAAGAYSVYALWDNRQVYASAEDAREALLAFKPEPGGEEASGPGFRELLAINPDVRAWLTMDGTAIDHPVLQGEDNLRYISTDVYGDFALAGSVFMDARCAPDFTDAYTLVYGHHMDAHRMFGDLALYEDPGFFAENSTGTLVLPEGAYRLEVVACVKAAASEPTLFDPVEASGDMDALLRIAEENAVNIHSDAMRRVRGEDAPRLLALSTCASDFTDARTVVLARMEPYLP